MAKNTIENGGKRMSVQKPCKIIVNNCPKDTDQWIVARIGKDGSLWYWGGYSENAKAENVANTIGGIVVESID